MNASVSAGRHTAELLDQVPGRRAVGEAADVRGDVAEHEPEQRERDQPAHERAALQAPGQAERSAQTPARVRAAESIREQAGAVVAAANEQMGGAGQHNEEREGDEHDPPAVALERAHLLTPSNGRQPAYPGRPAVAGRVADRPEHIGDAEERHRDRDGGPSARRELSSHGRDRGERYPDARPGQPECDRARSGQPRSDQPEAGEQTQREVGAHADGERGRQRGVPSDDRRADEFEPAGLLLGPGVADHDQDGEDRDQRTPERPEFDHGEGAYRRLVVDEAVQRHQRRRVVDGGRRLGSRLDTVVETDGCPGGAGRGDDEDEDPHREHQPVAAEREPDQRSGTGQRTHADAPAPARPGWVTSSW